MILRGLLGPADFPICSMASTAPFRAFRSTMSNAAGLAAAYFTSCSPEVTVSSVVPVSFAVSCSLAWKKISSINTIASAMNTLFQKKSHFPCTMRGAATQGARDHGTMNRPPMHSQGNKRRAAYSGCRNFICRDCSGKDANNTELQSM